MIDIPALCDRISEAGDESPEVLHMLASDLETAARELSMRLDRLAS